MPHTGHMAERTYTISNSEVTEYQTCQRSHYYHFAMGIEPKVLLTKLERGVEGHKALQIVYTVKANGGSAKDAIDLAAKSIMEASLVFMQSSYAAEDQTYRVKMYADLINVIKAYIDRYWNDDPFETVALEQIYKVPINDTVTLGCRVDRLAVYTQYPFKGDYVVIDWKFRMNYLSDEMLKLHPQLPKYIWATSKAIGKPVTKGFMDIIRYRQMQDKSAMFGRPLFKTKPALRDKIIQLHTEIAEEIVARKKLPLKEYSKLARRTLNELACKDCVFAKICTLELYDQDPTSEINANFKPSEYGYEVDEFTYF